MKKLVSIGLFSICGLGIAACSTETVYKPVPAPGGETPGTEQKPPGPAAATGTIGAAGGSVEADGLVLEVPAGALAEDTDITITKSEDDPPARHQGLTKLYTFEPAGLKFKKPAKLIFKKLPADAVEPVVGTEKTAGVFEGQPTKAEADGASAPISKLATAFAASHDCKDDAEGAKAVCKAVPAPAALESHKLNGFALTGFEYWQWFKPDPYKNGDEVAWGYNGDGVPKTGVMPTDQSRACMAESFKALEAILADPPQELKDLSAAKGVNQFWFWNNDMSDAKASVKVPKDDSELWLYAGDRGDGGLIKWISSTERDGVCHLPTRSDLVTFAKACKTAFPNCGSGK